MSDITTATDDARMTAETEASREVAAHAAPDDPNPATDDAGPRTDGATDPAQAGVGPASSEAKPIERITTADRSRADIAARFREKRAATGGQVEFHGDMRDPSQTYAGFAPQSDEGTASPLTSPRSRGEVDARSAAGEGGLPNAQASGESPSPDRLRSASALDLSPQAGRGDAAAAAVAPSPPPDQARLVKVKVHGREAWLPEAEVIAEAQKSLAAGNLLESAKEVLSGARSQMSDAGDQISDVRGQMSETTDLASGIRHPSSDPYLALAQTLQLEDAAAAGGRLKQTIEGETARARQEASRQVRIENELAVSQKALAAFEQTHPELAADDFARDAITTQVQREINADLQAAVNQGILSDLPRTQDERNGLHTQLRAFGAQAARPIGDLFAAAGTKYQAWRGGTASSAPGAPEGKPALSPQTTAAPSAPRVELTTARQQRRAQIPTQPTNGTAPPRGAPPPEQTTAQRRSAAISAMRKARGQITA